MGSVTYAAESIGITFSTPKGDKTISVPTHDADGRNLAGAIDFGTALTLFPTIAKAAYDAAIVDTDDEPGKERCQAKPTCHCTIDNSVHAATPEDAIKAYSNAWRENKYIKHFFSENPSFKNYSKDSNYVLTVVKIGSVLPISIEDVALDDVLTEYYANPKGSEQVTKTDVDVLKDVLDSIGEKSNHYDYLDSYSDSTNAPATPAEVGSFAFVYDKQNGEDAYAVYVHSDTDGDHNYVLDGYDDGNERIIVKNPETGEYRSFSLSKIVDGRVFWL